jgi:hypothetical protein
LYREGEHVTDLGELWSRVVRYLREPLILLDTSDGRCIDATPRRRT